MPDAPRWVAESTDNYTVNVTTFTVNLPASIEADDIIVCSVNLEGVRTDAAFPTTGDFTQLARSDTGVTMLLFGKVSDGNDSSDTHDVDLPTSASGSAITWVIRGANPTMVEGLGYNLSTAVTGSGTSVDPPNVNGSWAEKNLFIVVGGAADDDETVTAWPTSYTHRQTQVNGGGGTNNGSTSFFAARQVDATSDNPTALTLSASENYVVYTLVLRPILPLRQPGGAYADGAGTIAFTPNPEIGQVDSNIEIVWDFDGDGDFSEAIENITSYVISAETSVGRDSASQLNGKVNPGRFRATLDNSDDRFSFFNSSSPLNTSPFSLDDGKLLRVQIAGTSDTDPVLLAKDYFSGTGALGGSPDQAGNTWEVVENGGHYRSGTGVARPMRPYVSSTDYRSVDVVDLGVDACFMQATYILRDIQTNLGVVYRLTDEDNYGLIAVEANASNFLDVQHWTNTAGTFVKTGQITIEDTTELTLQVLISGTILSIFINGDLRFTPTAYGTGGQKYGIYSQWPAKDAPEWDEFCVWNTWGGFTNADVLWTGRVTSVVPTAEPGGKKFAALEAEGPLSMAANTDVDSIETVGADEGASEGTSVSIAVGHALRRGGLLHPVGDINPTNSALVLNCGGHAYTQRNLLSLLRVYENTDLGYVFECNEGRVCFLYNHMLSANPPTTEFSDLPGAQYVYESMQLHDWRGERVNRVVSPVPPYLPNIVAGQSPGTSSSSGVANAVDMQVPATLIAVGDLAVLFIVSTVHDSAEQWVTPFGWHNLRDAGTELGKVRVYAKVLTADDVTNRPVTTFYNDSASSGGSWEMHALYLRDWYGSVESGTAIAVSGYGEPETGSIARQGQNTTPVLSCPWGATATVYLACIGGMDGGTASGGGDVPSITASATPFGMYHLDDAMRQGLGTNAFDVGYQTAGANRAVDVFPPGSFLNPPVGFDFLETVVLAVRGNEGQPPPSLGGRVVISDNEVSQFDLGAIKTWKHTDSVFSSVTDAENFNSQVLAKYADPLPLVTISFTATKRVDYRYQAYIRRFGDKIHLVATGNSGMGIDRNYLIVAIRHRWSHGVTSWITEWDLSPA